jgi:putative transposase
VACPFRRSRLQVKSGGIGLVSGESWPPRSTPAELRRVGDALIARMPEIVERHFDELRDTVPGYESLSVEDLGELWRDSFTSAAREIFVSAAVVTPEEVRADAARRIAGGIPIESVIAGTVLSFEIVWAEAKNLSEAIDAAPDTLDEARSTMRRALSARLKALADLHADTILDDVLAEDHRRSRFLSELVNGVADASLVASSAQRLGLDQERDYIAFRARGDADDLRRLQQDVEISAESYRETAVAAIDAGDLIGITPRRQDLSLRAGTIGISPRARLGQMRSAFAAATLALTTAVAYGLTGTYGLEELSIRSAVLSHPRLTDAFAKRYVHPLRPLGDFGPILIETVRCYLDQRFDVDRCSRTLVVHPNTVRHRLQRFESITGADLASPRHIAEIYWLLSQPGEPISRAGDDAES